MASADLGRRCEFHTHTFFSDGVLCPTELVRRAFVLGDQCIAITDHVDFTNIEHVLKSQLKLKGKIDWDLRVLIGVELTHIPVSKIPKIAGQAKKLGAEIIVGHGETPMEPVEAGTNRAYVSCNYMDILAHPGRITVEDAERARENNVFLELTSRKGHNQGNKFVSEAALKAKARLIVDTDAHEPEDFITQEHAYTIALMSGLDQKTATDTVVKNPAELMKKLGV